MDPKFLLQRKAMSLQRNGYRKILYFQKITISYASNRVLFGKEISQLNVAKLSAFYKEPFYDWKHGIQRFMRHASSAIHIFLFVNPVARVLANGNRTIETVMKRYVSQKITHLKVPVQHVLDVYTTTKFIQPNMV